MSRWALIPIKGFDRGKSRLAAVLDARERESLARHLFEHVVRVLVDAPSVDRIAVVSDSPEVREHAARLDVVPLADTPEAEGLADVVDEALAELERQGATSAVICMSDLPNLAVHDIESVSRELEDGDVVLVPDLLHRGTNVIAVRPPTALPSCLGREDSLDQHRARGRDLGLSVSVHVSSGIGFDVDHPDDLARLRRR